MSPNAKSISCAAAGASGEAGFAYKYDFFGAVCHTRSHYWTEVKHKSVQANSVEYFECNDTKVQKTTRKLPRSKEATIVAYRRNLIAPPKVMGHSQSAQPAVPKAGPPLQASLAGATMNTLVSKMLS